MKNEQKIDYKKIEEDDITQVLFTNDIEMFARLKEALMFFQVIDLWVPSKHGKDIDDCLSNWKFEVILGLNKMNENPDKENFIPKIKSLIDQGIIRVKMIDSKEAYEKGAKSEFIKKMATESISKSQQSEMYVKQKISDLQIDFDFLILDENRFISKEQRYFAENMYKYLRIKGNQKDALLNLYRNDNEEVERIMGVLRDPHSRPKALVQHALELVYPNYEQYKLNDIMTLRDMEESKKIRVFINNIVFSPENEHKYRGRKHTFHQELQHPITNLKAETRNLNSNLISNIVKKSLYIGTGASVAQNLLTPTAEIARWSSKLDELSHNLIKYPNTPCENYQAIYNVLTLLQQQSEVIGKPMLPILVLLSIILGYNVVSSIVERITESKNLESKNTAIFATLKLRRIDEAITGLNPQGKDIGTLKKLKNNIPLIKSDIHKMKIFDTSPSELF